MKKNNLSEFVVIEQYDLLSMDALAIIKGGATNYDCSCGTANNNAELSGDCVCGQGNSNKSLDECVCGAGNSNKKTGRGTTLIFG